MLFCITDTYYFKTYCIVTNGYRTHVLLYVYMNHYTNEIHVSVIYIYIYIYIYSLYNIGYIDINVHMDMELDPILVIGGT